MEQNTHCGKTRYPLIDLIKWVALALMFYDHSMAIFYEGYADSLFRILGRMCFPLFALGFSATAKINDRTKERVLILACIAQVGYFMIFGLKLNILFTFLLGLYSFPLAMGFGLVMDSFLDGGLFGVLMVWFAVRADIPFLKTPVSFNVYPAKQTGLIYALHFLPLLAVLIVTKANA